MAVTGVAMEAPIVQKYPAVQSPVTADLPVPVQYLPGGHGRQSVGRDLVVTGLYVPDVHAIARPDPAGQ